MSLLDFLDRTGQFCHFISRCLPAALGAIRGPREVCRHLYGILIGALPLGAVAGLALGIVIWMHLHRVLERFRAAEKLPEALALAVVLEFAPTGAGLIVAGRSGASLGAELGSMRLTEQIDALEVLGLSPLRQLVGPRVLACVLTLPLLTIVIAFLALSGGFGAEWLGGGMSARQYAHACVQSLRIEDVMPALLKTLVFGYLIGATGCYFGMTASGGTEGVGRAATRGVVFSTFMVLASDVLLVRLIQTWPGAA